MWQPSWSAPREGWFYPPTLCTDCAPSGTLAQVEIFGPVVVMMTFRTPAEAVELANDTRYGLAASIWTESVNLALDVAPKVKAGTVWVNCTNLFDAASGLRRLPGERVRARGRPRGAVGVRAALVGARGPRAAGLPARPRPHRTPTSPGDAGWRHGGSARPWTAPRSSTSAASRRAPTATRA